MISIFDHPEAQILNNLHERYPDKFEQIEELRRSGDIYKALRKWYVRIDPDLKNYC